MTDDPRDYEPAVCKKCHRVIYAKDADPLGFCSLCPPDPEPVMKKTENK